ncbi:MAG: chromosomal replication initiator DnaA [Pseudolabrys sp.]|nr:chromosomal replication initiator DnaA [Pseudolabrys sp.]
MSAQFASRQLTLALGHDESFARDDFVSGAANAAGLDLVERWPDWPSKIVALIGPEGCGKTHLATIWAEATGARILSAKLLSEVDPTAALATGALVVDDLAPNGLAERALFHLLNLAREENVFVLLTARSAPSSWPIEIRDLQSRLRALPAVAMAPPEEKLLRTLIVKLAADRQLMFDGSLVSFLVSRIERSFAGAREAVNRLDQEAMRQKRPVTRALAAELFRPSAH